MTRRLALAVFLAAAAASSAADVDRYGIPLPEGAIARCGTAHLRVEAVNGRVFTLSADARFVTLDSPRGAWLWDAATKEFRFFPTSVQPAHTRLSGDGKLLVTNLKTHLNVWDAATGKLVRRIPAQGTLPAELTHLAVSPDGSRVAALADNGFVHVWESATGRQVLHAKSHDGWTAGVAFADDGRRVVTLSRRGDVCSWDAATGQEMARKQIDVNVYDQLHLSDDGATIVDYTAEKRVVRQWDAATAKEGPVIDWDGTPTGRAAVSPDGKTIAVVYKGDPHDNWPARLIDRASGKELRRFSVPRNSTDTLTLTRDGRLFILVGPVENVTLRDAAGGPPLLELPPAGQTVSAVAVAPDDGFVVSATEDGTLRTWDLPGGVVRRKLAPLGGAPRDLSFTADGRNVIACPQSGPPLCLDPRSGDNGWRVPEGSPVAPPGEFRLPNTPAQVVVTAREELGSDDVMSRWYDTWDAATGRCVARQRRVAGRFCLAISADGRYAAEGVEKHGVTPTGTVIGMYDPVVIRDLAAARDRASLAQPVGCAGVAAFSPDGHTLLTWNLPRVPGAAATPCLWEVATGRPQLQLSVPATLPKGNESAAFTADGRTLFLTAPKVQLFVDVATGRVKQRRPVEPDDDEVASAAFSADGRRLATGLANGTVLVWDTELATRRERAALSERDREACWAALAQADAAAAYAAAGRLADDPEATVTLFRDRLKPAAAVPAAAIRQRLAELDSPQFAVREAATRALAEFGDQAEPALKLALAGPGSPERRKRIERLLGQTYVLAAAEALRRLRAVQVLSGVGSADARAELKRLAEGDPAAYETKTARAALLRLGEVKHDQPGKH